jgi:hypothetical protein
LEAVFDRAVVEKQEISLAFDNDQAGKHIRQELVRILQEKQCGYRIELPQEGKDWNEVLDVQGRDEAVRKFLAEDKLYGFPEVKYEDSMLHRAGISHSALHGVALKAKERSVIFGLHQDVSTPQLCSTVTYQSGRERKYFQQGLPRGLAVLSPEKRVEHIVVMESPFYILF